MPCTVSLSAFQFSVLDLNQRVRMISLVGDRSLVGYACMHARLGYVEMRLLDCDGAQAVT